LEIIVIWPTFSDATFNQFCIAGNIFIAGRIHDPARSVITCRYTLVSRVPRDTHFTNQIQVYENGSGALCQKINFRRCERAENKADNVAMGSGMSRYTSVSRKFPTPRGAQLAKNGGYALI